MITAACLAAALDRERIEHVTFRVYLVLHAHLDTGEPRPLKRIVIAKALGIAEGQVTFALRALEAAGYVERGPNAGPPGRQVRTYRLTLSPFPTDRLLPLRTA